MHARMATAENRGAKRPLSEEEEEQEDNVSKRTLPYNTIGSEVAKSDNPVRQLSRIVSTAFDEGIQLWDEAGKMYQTRGFSEEFIQSFLEIDDDENVGDADLLKQYKTLFKIYRDICSKLPNGVPKYRFNTIVYNLVLGGGFLLRDANSKGRCDNKVIVLDDQTVHYSMYKYKSMICFTKMQSMPGASTYEIQYVAHGKTFKFNLDSSYSRQSSAKNCYTAYSLSSCLHEDKNAILVEGMQHDNWSELLIVAKSLCEREKGTMFRLFKYIQQLKSNNLLAVLLGTICAHAMAGESSSWKILHTYPWVWAFVCGKPSEIVKLANDGNLDKHLMTLYFENVHLQESFNTFGSLEEDNRHEFNDAIVKSATYILKTFEKKIHFHVDFNELFSSLGYFLLQNKETHTILKKKAVDEMCHLTHNKPPSLFNAMSKKSILCGHTEANIVALVYTGLCYVAKSKRQHTKEQNIKMSSNWNEPNYGYSKKIEDDSYMDSDLDLFDEEDEEDNDYFKDTMNDFLQLDNSPYKDEDDMLLPVLLPSAPEIDYESLQLPSSIGTNNLPSTSDQIQVLTEDFGMIRTPEVQYVNSENFNPHVPLPTFNDNDVIETSSHISTELILNNEHQTISTELPGHFFTDHHIEVNELSPEKDSEATTDQRREEHHAISTQKNNQLPPEISTDHHKHQTVTAEKDNELSTHQHIELSAKKDNELPPEMSTDHHKHQTISAHKDNEQSQPTDHHKEVNKLEKRIKELESLVDEIKKNASSQEEEWHRRNQLQEAVIIAKQQESEAQEFKLKAQFEEENKKLTSHIESLQNKKGNMAVQLLNLQSQLANEKDSAQSQERQTSEHQDTLLRAYESEKRCYESMLDSFKSKNAMLESKLEDIVGEFASFKRNNQTQQGMDGVEVEQCRLVTLLQEEINNVKTKLGYELEQFKERTAFLNKENEDGQRQILSMKEELNKKDGELIQEENECHQVKAAYKQLEETTRNEKEEILSELNKKGDELKREVENCGQYQAAYKQLEETMRNVKEDGERQILSLKEELVEKEVELVKTLQATFKSDKQEKELKIDEEERSRQREAAFERLDDIHKKQILAMKDKLKKKEDELIQKEDKFRQYEATLHESYKQKEKEMQHLLDESMRKVEHDKLSLKEQLDKYMVLQKYASSLEKTNKDAKQQISATEQLLQKGEHNRQRQIEDLRVLEVELKERKRQLDDDTLSLKDQLKNKEEKYAELEKTNEDAKLQILAKERLLQNRERDLETSTKNIKRLTVNNEDLQRQIECIGARDNDDSLTQLNTKLRKEIKEKSELILSLEASLNVGKNEMRQLTQDLEKNKNDNDCKYRNTLRQLSAVQEERDELKSHIAQFKEQEQALQVETPVVNDNKKELTTLHKRLLRIERQNECLKEALKKGEPTPPKTSGGILCDTMFIPVASNRRGYVPKMYEDKLFSNILNEDDTPTTSFNVLLNEIRLFISCCNLASSTPMGGSAGDFSSTARRLCLSNAQVCKIYPVVVHHDSNPCTKVMFRLILLLALTPNVQFVKKQDAMIPLCFLALPPGGDVEFDSGRAKFVVVTKTRARLAVLAQYVRKIIQHNLTHNTMQITV